MKLLDGGMAPNPRRVRIFLAEKGISVPLEQVDIGKREHRTPDYTALNPVQLIPTLVLDDGTPIAESIAICRYFEEVQPDPPLFGTGAVGRAMVEMWQRRVEFGLLATVAAVFRHTHPFMAELEVPQVPDWAESNRSRVGPFLELLDRRLAESEFVAGDAYSVADITAMVSVDFMRLPKIARPEGLENLERWHRQVAARPSAKA